MQFSLFYFASSEGGDDDDRYRLILESARFADENGFVALWTPERHFHAFGGLSPNPAVLAAGLATATRRVQLRPGSVVLPLHDPLRVVEEWSLVDNLSSGRVGLGVASGWFPNDFALAPDAYNDRKQIMFERLEEVRKLWRGETIARRNGVGKTVELRTMPRPIQREVPIWITSAMNPETFREAGAIGANLLTHLLWQTPEQLGQKIRVYRDAWNAAGHPGSGTVTLMLHTFVGEDDEQVHELVREPMKKYLGSSVDLAKNYLFSLSPFRGQPDLGIGHLSASDVDTALEWSFERYYRMSGLFGTPETCSQMVEQLRAVGVDEIGCLIDFGVETERVLGSLDLLNAVREQANRAVAPAADLDEQPNDSIVVDEVAAQRVKSAAPTLILDAVVQPAAATSESGATVRSADELERLLVAIWSEALGCTHVDPGVNLFDLGVHSLMAVQVLGNIQKRTGLRLMVTDLFRFPTVRHLAAHLAAPAHAPGSSGQRAQPRRQALRRRQPVS
jgi:natural product biosynthesis luciferase-like monooxygenase protein